MEIMLTIYEPSNNSVEIQGYIHSLAESAWDYTTPKKHSYEDSVTHLVLEMADFMFCCPCESVILLTILIKLNSLRIILWLRIALVAYYSYSDVTNFLDTQHNRKYFLPCEKGL